MDGKPIVAAAAEEDVEESVVEEVGKTGGWMSREANAMIVSPIRRSLISRSDPYSLRRTPIWGTLSAQYVQQRQSYIISMNCI